jgi:hypothetical protein
MTPTAITAAGTVLAAAARHFHDDLTCTTNIEGWSAIDVKTFMDHVIHPCRREAPAP